jgi:acetoin utilization deacetylase AcuC-like enzyme
MRLTLSGYDRLARLLCQLAEQVCGGRIIFVLEGGYNLQVLSHGWANVARALLGDSEIADPIGPTREIHRPLEGLIAHIKGLHEFS